MTPAQQAKSVGLKSLTQVSQITDVSLNTLINWHRDKPDLFKVVLIGCLNTAKPRPAYEDRPHIAELERQNMQSRDEE